VQPYFELRGFDILFDSDLNPNLLESDTRLSQNLAFALQTPIVPNSCKQMKEGWDRKLSGGATTKMGKP
jgi:hypothetical protein